jgi:hypothetical protein
MAAATSVPKRKNQAIGLAVLITAYAACTVAMLIAEVALRINAACGVTMFVVEGSA